MNPALPAPRDMRFEVVALFAAIASGAILVVAPRDLIFVVAVLSALTALSAWRPVYGLGALLLTVPIQASVTLGLGARQLTFTKIALAALVAGWLFRLVFRGELPRLNFVLFAFIAYLCALLASIWNAQDHSAWAGEVYRWLTAALIYAIASSVFRRRDDFVAILLATGVSVIACAIAAVAQVVRHSGPPSFTIGGVTRAFGAFGEPNPFAAYFEIAALPLAGIALTLLLSSGRRRHLLAIGAAGFAACAGLLGVYLTHSRGGAIGTAAGVVAIGLVVDRRVRLLVLGLAGVAALGLMLTGSADREVNRLDSLAHGWNSPIQVTSANFSVEERVAHWGAAVRMWEAHPIVGVGAGNFNDNFRVYTPEWRFRIPRGHAHNNYLQAAAQAGTLGLVSYVALLGAALFACARALRRSADVWERAVAVGAIGATIAVMTHGVFDYLHVLNLGLQLSVVWASVEFSQLHHRNESKKGNRVV